GELRVVASWSRGEQLGGAAEGGSPSRRGDHVMQAAAPSVHRPAAPAPRVQRPAADSPGASPALVAAVIEHVRAIARERAGELSADTNIVLDLGLDSLER